jgi:hypothetical protein
MTLTTELEHLVNSGDVRFEGCKQGILIHPMSVNWRSARQSRIAKSHAEWASVRRPLFQLSECFLHSFHSVLFDFDGSGVLEQMQGISVIALIKNSKPQTCALYCREFPIAYTQ